MTESLTYPVRETRVAGIPHGINAGRTGGFVVLDVSDHARGSSSLTVAQILQRLEGAMPDAAPVIISDATRAPETLRLGPLLGCLRSYGYSVHLHTSGYGNLPKSLDWIVLQLRVGEPVPPDEALSRAHEIEIEVTRASVLDVESFVSRVLELCRPQAQVWLCGGGEEAQVLRELAKRYSRLRVR